MHYMQPLKTLTDNKEWKKAALLLEDYIDTYEPHDVRGIKPFYKCRYLQEAEVYSFFSWIHNIHGQILVPTGDKQAAEREAQISVRLKEAGSP
jgi:hypothetical protein